MDERELRLHRVAALHYRAGVTMEAIARQLSVSRSTVSRLLRDARAAGIVRISVVEPVDRDDHVVALERRFGVRVVSVPVWPELSDQARLEAVARAASSEVGGWLRDHDRPRVGLAWGTTVAALVAALEPLDCRAQVVQVNGAANPAATGLPYAGAILAGAARAWRGSVLQFPVPAFFDYAETKAAMWRERSIQAVIAAQDAVDLAVFGVGALGRGTRSHVYSGGYLDAADVGELRAARVVGDVCTVMLRSDGSHEGVPLNERASGMAPDRLRRVPRRLCVASGVDKAKGLVAALRAGVVSVLVADSDLVAAAAQRSGCLVSNK